jgi:hypothetical protein
VRFVFFLRFTHTHTHWEEGGGRYDRSRLAPGRGPSGKPRCMGPPTKGAHGRPHGAGRGRMGPHGAARMGPSWGRIWGCEGDGDKPTGPQAPGA